MLDVRVFPRTDQVFGRAVRDALDGLEQSGISLPGPGLLSERLQQAYPHVRVQPQDPLGQLGSQRLVLYVFRDDRVRL